MGTRQPGTRQPDQTDTSHTLEVFKGQKFLTKKQLLRYLIEGGLQRGRMESVPTHNRWKASPRTFVVVRVVNVSVVQAHGRTRVLPKMPQADYFKGNLASYFIILGDHKALCAERKALTSIDSALPWFFLSSSGSVTTFIPKRDATAHNHYTGPYVMVNQSGTIISLRGVNVPDGVLQVRVSLHLRIAEIYEHVLTNPRLFCYIDGTGNGQIVDISGFSSVPGDRQQIAKDIMEHFTPEQDPRILEQLAHKLADKEANWANCEDDAEYH
eukprot:TRINITY_DN177_c0_g1_i1.p1 TRINITY_DN177_c0_g1~~TRINITY_DN177_c0_g1_i1.p1  ORF type:complete len:290 (-),score=34.52 TRINITY_DN177_c0_g1_i1:159-965(-)